MKPDLEILLDECLARLQAGQKLEDVLKEYPEQAEGLRGLLAISLSLGQVRIPQPSHAAVRLARRRMLAAYRDGASGERNTIPVSSARPARYTGRKQGWLNRIFNLKEEPNMKFAIRVAATLALILVFGSVITVSAAADSLPGEPLYGVKRSWEQVRFSFTTQPQARQSLEENYSLIRQQEIQTLLRQGRQAAVDYSGILQSAGPQEWIVGGLEFQVSPNTSIVGNPLPGDRVTVNALVEAGGILLAQQIQAQALAADETPTATGTETATPIADTPTPSDTNTPTTEATVPSTAVPPATDTPVVSTPGVENPPLTAPPSVEPPSNVTPRPENTLPPDFTPATEAPVSGPGEEDPANGTAPAVEPTVPGGSTPAPEGPVDPNAPPEDEPPSGSGPGDDPESGQPEGTQDPGSAPGEGPGTTATPSTGEGPGGVTPPATQPPEGSGPEG